MFQRNSFGGEIFENGFVATLKDFSTSLCSARNDETTEIKHYLILVNKKAPFPHLRIGASLVKRLGLIRL
jgi:hypothetical protein